MPPDPLSSYTATAASPAFHTLFLLFLVSFNFQFSIIKVLVDRVGQLSMCKDRHKKMTTEKIKCRFLKPETFRNL
jgi:hypothetical protein